MLTQIEAQHALDRIILRVTGGSMQNVVSLSELWLQTPPLVKKKQSANCPACLQNMVSLSKFLYLVSRLYLLP